MEFTVDWNSVCLVCLQEGEMKSIYEADDSHISYCDKIVHCSNIEIQKGMNLPEQICKQCVDDLDAAYRFRTNCESSNIILKSFIEAKVTDVEIPSSNGQMYKYKPPSGLNVKRIKCAPKFDVKLEQIAEDNDNEDVIVYGTDVDNNFESHDDDNDMYIDDESESNLPISNFKSDKNPEKVEINIVKEEDDPIMEVQVSIEKNDTDSNPALEEKTPPKTGKRGRPRNILRRPKLENEITSENISSLVSAYTTVTYVRKGPEEEKPLKICEICGNGYKYQHALDSHMRRHRNEKPFSCDFCDRAFVANVELRRHMRVHTGQKPYACRYCDRRFSDFGSRIKHERTHTGERPYQCTTCGKAFGYAHVLSVHNLTHTGEKKYKCDICGKGFTKKIYLKSHITSRHDSSSASSEQIPTHLTNRKNMGKLVNSDQVIILKSEPLVTEIIDTQVVEGDKTITYVSVN